MRGFFQRPWHPLILSQDFVPKLSASPVDVAELEQTLSRASGLRATLPATDEAALIVREGRDELAERFERR
jgi:hypothetical protein